MPANQENIEARLCAYIDAQLSDADRAQLEKTLASNPEGRRLLEELVRLRQMLRELPKVPAPPDLVEAVQARLERGLLLDQPTPQDEALRFSYWPRMVAVAAVLLLTVGLGTVVFLILPRHPQSSQVAISLPRINDRIAGVIGQTPSAPADMPKPITTPPVAVADTDGTSHDIGGRINPETPLGTGNLSHNAAIPTTPATALPENKSIPAATDGRLLTDNAEVRQAREEMTGGLPQSYETLAQAAVNAPVVLVIHTGDFDKTNQAVVNYLNKNKIISQAVPAQALSDVANAQVFSGNTTVAGGQNVVPNSDHYDYRGAGENQNAPQHSAQTTQPQKPARAATPAPAAPTQQASPRRIEARARVVRRGNSQDENPPASDVETNGGQTARSMPQSGNYNSEGSLANKGPGGPTQTPNGNLDSGGSPRVVLLARMSLQQAQALQKQLLSSTSENAHAKGAVIGFVNNGAIQVDLIDLADKSLQTPEAEGYAMPHSPPSQGMGSLAASGGSQAQVSPSPTTQQTAAAAATAPSESFGYAKRSALTEEGESIARPLPPTPPQGGASSGPATQPEAAAAPPAPAAVAAAPPQVKGELQAKMADTQNLDVVIVLSADASLAAAASPAPAPALTLPATQPAPASPAPVPATQTQDK